MATTDETTEKRAAGDPEPIETERLRLRMFRADDLDALAEIYADNEVMQWMGTGGTVPRERVEAAIPRFNERFREHGFGLFAVERKEDNALIGWCGIVHLDNTPEVEIGYMLGQPFWGKGYATEAAMSVRDFAFNVVGLPRLVGITRPGNTRSQHVLEKIGLRYERDAVYYNFECNYFALNRDEYEKQRQQQGE